MNAKNHMAQSETKEYAIAKDKKENTYIRKEKSCLEKCLISYKKKHSEKKIKKIIHLNHKSCTASLGKKS